jgi:hypothetical protein
MLSWLTGFWIWPEMEKGNHMKYAQSIYHDENLSRKNTTRTFHYLRKRNTFTLSCLSQTGLQSSLLIMF